VGRQAGAWRWGVVVSLAALAALLPGVFSIPAVDRDESRFAQASAQMAASDGLGGWVVPWVQERPRLI